MNWKPIKEGGMGGDTGMLVPSLSQPPPARILFLSHTARTPGSMRVSKIFYIKTTQHDKVINQQ